MFVVYVIQKKVLLFDVCQKILHNVKSNFIIKKKKKKKIFFYIRLNIKYI